MINPVDFMDHFDEVTDVDYEAVKYWGRKEPPNDVLDTLVDALVDGTNASGPFCSSIEIAIVLVVRFKIMGLI